MESAPKWIFSQIHEEQGYHQLYPTIIITLIKIGFIYYHLQTFRGYNTNTLSKHQGQR